MKDDFDITAYFHPIFAGDDTNSILIRNNFILSEDTPRRPVLSKLGDHATARTIAPAGTYTISMSNPFYHSDPEVHQLDLNYSTVVYADDHLLQTLVLTGKPDTTPRSPLSCWTRRYTRVLAAIDINKCCKAG